MIKNQRGGIKMKAIDNKELILALEELEKEKGIKKEYVLESAIIQSMQKNIDSHKSDTVYVPLGSCSNLYFLAGLGPNVPIRIYPVNIVNADFKESFDSVGINQVKHKLYLDVSMKMSFVGMMFAQSDTVETSVLLNETIIVGDTPTYYGNGGMTASVE